MKLGYFDRADCNSASCYYRRVKRWLDIGFITGKFMREYLEKKRT